MAEAKKGNSNSSKKTCREKVSRFRERMSVPYNWFMQYLPVACVVVCSVVIGRIWWYNIAGPNTCTGIDDLCREGIESSLCTNIILMIGVVYAFITLLFSIFLRPKWWHLPIYIIAAIYIYVIPQWSAIQTAIPNLSYTLLLTCILAISGLAELCLLLIDECAKEKLNELPSGEYGFAIKTEESDLVDTGWDNYITTIFELVGQTQLEKESFAIGITGNWGSGKTTFYDAVRRKIYNDKQFLLCEFKPWQILESERITPEFFAEFAKVISEGSEEQNMLLRDNIIKYAQLLTAVPEVSGFVNLFTSIIGSDEEKSIQSLRNKIDKQLQSSKTNIAVLIDDLDRLNKDELLEIMRLVRASANFKHVLFILTYDKGYFNEILDEEQGLDYLKKIVNIEISLPPIERYKYGQLLEESVSAMFNESITQRPDDKKLIKEMLWTLNQIIRNENAKAEESLLYEKLSNFRDIKRFANQFCLALRYICDCGILKQYNFHDLFWLEFLHYIDDETYTKLKNNYQEYLQVVKSHNGISLLKVKDDTIKDLKSPLWYLFPDNQQVLSENSIRLTSNYYGYFAYRQLENYIPATEFKFLLSANTKEYVAEKIINWLMDDHKRDSVFQHLQDYPYQPTFSSREEAENYTFVLLSVLSNASKHATIDLIVDLFNRKYRKSFFINIKEYNPASTIRDFIMKQPNKRWNKVLSIMCPTWTEDMIEIEPGSRILDDIEYVIDMKELKELAILNYTSYFHKKDMPFDALFDSQSDYTKFIEQADYIKEVQGYKPKEVEIYSNLLGDYLTERFIASIKKRRKGDSTFTKIYNNLFDYSGADFVHNEDRSPGLLKEAIERTLGSVKNFETILNGCFKLGEKNIERCKRLGLNIKG